MNDNNRKVSTWVNDTARNVHSVGGEDGIVETIFETIGTVNKWCVEFGAGDITASSNTFHLLKNKGWRGILIEPEAQKVEKIERICKGYPNVVCIHSLVTFEGDTALDAILSRTSIPKAFDLLSIDIDGYDYHVWDAVHEYRPRVVIVEFNQTIPCDISFVQPRDTRVQQGSSLAALADLGKRKGYELVATTGNNAFFVQNEIFPLFEISDNSPCAMESSQKTQTRVFQLYDGTLVLDGCQKLLWHKIPIPEKKIQILPRYFRVFLPAMDSIRWPMFRLYRRVTQKLWRMEKEKNSKENFSK